MSTIYNLEPQPTASAIIHTTLGEILVELFAKQTPLTCRNFLQLSLDGYYDNTVFHRLVPGFILQGGDPTGTGNGGESIYDGGAYSGDLEPWPMDQRQGKNAGPKGVNFKDEFHSRLKFNRRGLLAMANEGRPDTNGSQFFFTLDKTEELNGKNTLFGRVAGDTIYNLAKIGESEVATGSERPLYSVKVQRIEILINPFADMVKRSRVAAQISQPKPITATKKKKPKGGKQLLSFADEESEEGPIPKKTKIDTRLFAEEVEDTKQSAIKPKKEKRRPGKKIATTEENAPKLNASKQTKPLESAHSQRLPRNTSPRSESESESESGPDCPKKSALEKANGEIAELKASLRRTVYSQQPEEKPKSALEQLIPDTAIRGRKRRHDTSAYTKADDAAALKLLKDFQAKLDGAPQEKDKPQPLDANDDPGQAGKGQDEEAELCDLHFIANCQSCTAWDAKDKDASDEGWMSHALTFAADKLGKDLSNRRKAEEELVVIDPREKARSMKEGQRAGRTGDGGRAWDQARDQALNAKLARAASLAGRGAT